MVHLREEEFLFTQGKILLSIMWKYLQSKTDICHIFIPNINLNLITIYKSFQAKNQDFLKDFDLMLGTLNNDQKTVIVGDFNIDILKNNNITEEYTQIIKENLFQQQIDQITRYTNLEMKLGTCIDHLITHLTNVNYEIDINSLSDHCHITLEIIFEKKIYTSKNIRTIKSNEEINIINQNYLSCKLNDNQTFEEYTKLLKKIHYESFNETTLIEYEKPWLTEEIIKNTRYKNKLYKKIKKQPFNTFLRGKYKKINNNLKKLINNTKKSYLEKLTRDNNNSKKLWININTLIGRKKNNNAIINAIKMDNQKISTNPLEIANTFIQYWNKIIGNPPSNENNNLQDTEDDTDSSDNTNFIKFLITNTIDNLSLKNQTDFFGISSTLLFKNNLVDTNKIKNYISDIFCTGILPDWLNISRTIPIYKNKGKKNDVINYRPISVSNNLCKLIEKIMFSYLDFYITKNQFISKSQYAFQKNISTNDALLKLNYLIIKAKEDKLINIILFLDLKMAFDTVNHVIMIEKIRKIPNIPSKLIKLITTWLNTKKIFCDINGTYSKNIIKKSGIPQGSSLAPLLFIIFINDFITECEGISETIVYADDIAINITASDNDELKYKIGKITTIIEKWFKENLMQINYTKCNYINFSFRKAFGNFTIEIDKNQIQEVNDIKYLGIIIDRNLNFTSHINYIINRINSRIGIIYRTRKFTSTELKLKLYEALIHSIIIYGLPLWQQCNKIPYNKLERKINKCLNYIDPLTTNKNIIERKRKLEIKNFLPYLSLTYFYKTINEINGLQIDIFKKIENRYNSRNQSNKNYQLPKFKTHTGQKSIFYQIIKIYNKLPNEIKHINNLANFKNAVKGWLLQNT